MSALGRTGIVLLLLGSVAAAPKKEATTDTKAGSLTLQTLDRAFASEKRDKAWAPVHERAIRAAKNDARLGGVTAIEPECRATMCRVTVSMKPEGARRTLHALLVTEPLNTSGYHALDPDDSSKIRMYVSRAGKRLQEHPVFVAEVKRRKVD